MAPLSLLDLNREQIEQIVMNSAELLLPYLQNRNDLHVEVKEAENDYVTDADKDVQTRIREQLEEAFPDTRIIGEELVRSSDSNIYNPSDDPDEFVWFIDPVDGSYNLAKGISNFAIALGLLHRQRPIFGVIYLPVTKQLLSGGTNWPAQCNRRDLGPLKVFNPMDAFAGIGLGERTPSAKKMAFLAAVTTDKMKFRRIGSASYSFAEVMLGYTDGYLSISEKIWGIVPGDAILTSMGAQTVFDWDRANLNGSLCVAIGTPAFIRQKLSPGSRLASFFISDWNGWKWYRFYFRMVVGFFIGLRGWLACWTS